METFIASRISEGNSVFPCRIVINEHHVTLKIPSFFSGDEETIPYSRISSVRIDCPFVGYSTIIIQTTGEGEVIAHGFTKSEVIRMKELILNNI